MTFEDARESLVHTQDIGELFGPYAKKQFHAAGITLSTQATEFSESLGATKMTDMFWTEDEV